MGVVVGVIVVVFIVLWVAIYLEVKNAPIMDDDGNIIEKDTNTTNNKR